MIKSLFFLSDSTYWFRDKVIKEQCTFYRITVKTGIFLCDVSRLSQSLNEIRLNKVLKVGLINDRKKVVVIYQREADSHYRLVQPDMMNNRWLQLDLRSGIL